MSDCCANQAQSPPDGYCRVAHHRLEHGIDSNNDSYNCEPCEIKSYGRKKTYRHLKHHKKVVAK